MVTTVRELPRKIGDTIAGFTQSIPLRGIFIKRNLADVLLILRVDRLQAHPEIMLQQRPHKRKGTLRT